ncbi:hypothetical protein ACHAXT_006195 [Thalassiosira profunda]
MADDDAIQKDATIEPTDLPKAAESDPNSCSPDDLIELVRAVKFAHTDYSIRNVHKEISVTMAASDPSCAFLKDVKLNDVKKVWKKALKGSPEPKTVAAEQKKDSAPATPTEAAAPKNAGSEPPIVPDDGVIKFFTVGDGSVKTLAENYANHYAKAAVAASEEQNAEMEQEKGKYTHFFLDVPADRSGSRPHQALISYKDNKQPSKWKGKKGNSAEQSTSDGKQIFKIQLPALPPGMEDAETVMLVYNADKSARTFIHPPSSSDGEQDDGGYSKIRAMIKEAGTSGALGATGGQKGYFYGFITKTKSGPDAVSIDVTAMVPSQSW